MPPPDEKKVTESDSLIKTNAEAKALLKAVLLTMSNNTDFTLQSRLIVGHIMSPKSRVRLVASCNSRCPLPTEESIES
jgi:hypothetical protein